jgi:uncharacterized membrane protein YkoI
MKSTFRIAAMALALTLAMNASAFAQGKGKGKDNQNPPDAGTKIEIDLSKLPPELAKQLLELSKAKGKTKTTQPAEKGKKVRVPNTGDPSAISLSKAISIAEKKGKGTAMSASRRDRGETTTFSVSVKTAEGVMRYSMDAAGTITKEQQGDGD